MAVLGIEGGATRTSAALMDAAGSVVARAHAAGSNIKLVSDRALAAIFRSIRKQIAQTPAVVSVCLAGAIAPSDHRKIRDAASKVWSNARCFTATDRESALMAGFGKLEGIVVICGTGSSTFGMRDGGLAKCGGWGHILGDRGSAYDLALRGLRLAIGEYDRSGKPDKLGRMFLQALNSNGFEEVVDWIQQASKAEIAAVASVVFRAARVGDPHARQILGNAAEHLAESVAIVSSRLRWRNPGVCLTGGVFGNQPVFFQLVKREILRRLPRASVRSPQHDGAVAAALLAKAVAPPPRPQSPVVTTLPMQDVAAALTEQRNPRTTDIDRKSAAQLFDVMMNEESRTIPAIREKKREIVSCIDAIVAALRGSGRLFYVGAGTSGRLGVLDASEIPPTFSAPPGMVQGILAGGMRALYGSVEEAEDDPAAGAAAIRNHGVTRRDVVVGIAASGRTPFVLGALREAAKIGAKPYLLTFNPAVRITNHESRITIIAVATGPEVVTGSTRLKAGTATKLILNMLTTISMIRLGKVVSNLMVDMRPSNEKLRDRACRIVMALRNCGYQEAWDRLQHAKWNVKQAALDR